MVCSEYSPNRFQLATAGDDETIKIWDLHQHRPSASIPAHTNLITQLKFAHSNPSQNEERFGPLEIGTSDYIAGALDQIAELLLVDSIKH